MSMGATGREVADIVEASDMKNGGRIPEAFSVPGSPPTSSPSVRACLAAAVYLNGGRKKRMSEMSST